jgi:hypothetical protein
MGGSKLFFKNEIRDEMIADWGRKRKGQEKGRDWSHVHMGSWVMDMQGSFLYSLFFGVDFHLSIMKSLSFKIQWSPQIPQIQQVITLPTVFLVFFPVPSSPQFCFPWPPRKVHMFLSLLFVCWVVSVSHFL